MSKLAELIAGLDATTKREILKELGAKTARTPRTPEQRAVRAARRERKAQETVGKTSVKKAVSKTGPISYSQATNIARSVGGPKALFTSPPHDWPNMQPRLEAIGFTYADADKLIKALVAGEAYCKRDATSIAKAKKIFRAVGEELGVLKVRRQSAKEDVIEEIKEEQAKSKRKLGKLKFKGK